MSKVVKTVAEKIAALRHIPPTMLPSTLKHNLMLPKISEMRFDYARNAR